jgi:dipeptidyl aminopeptidase/acylaminoacyl peptidase
VILIHGGPDWHFSFLWYPFIAHLTSRGWTVLAPNYRGSTGYGRDWQLANHFDLGGVDTDDVAAGAQYMVRAGLADSKHIALTGRSHGGYLTMCCLTRYPELWAAGSAVVPFLNWFTAHANARADLQHWDIENLGDPVENHDLWHERSPFFFLDRVRAPVQLICGANDPRCPACESVQARDKLQTLGKEVELVLYHDEGHGFLKIENVINAEVRRLAFLARALEEKCVASNSGG